MIEKTAYIQGPIDVASIGISSSSSKTFLSKKDTFQINSVLKKQFGSFGILYNWRNEWQRF